MTGLDQERLDQLAAARVLYEDDLAAFYALPREATAAESLAADVDPLLNDIEWLLGVVQQLRDENGNLRAALEDARRAVDLANRAGETEQERAVEQAFVRRARPGHVKTRTWPHWSPLMASYWWDCSCGWSGHMWPSEQAAHDEFDRHAAGKGPAEVWKHCRWREPHLAVPRAGSHYIQPGTGATEAACVTCGEAVVLVAGGETGDKQ